MLKEEELDRWIHKYCSYLRNEKRIQFKPALTQEEVRNDKNITSRMRRVVQTYEVYASLIEREYGVTINIVDCWQACIERYSINLLVMGEDKIIEYMNFYACIRRDEFKRIAADVQKELVEYKKSKGIQIEIKPVEREQERRDLELSFDDLFNKEEDKGIVLDIMIKFNFIDNDGRGKAVDQQKGELAGLIGALKKYDYIGDYTRAALEKIFCVKAGLKPSRLKYDTNKCDRAAEKIENYIKYTILKK